MVPPRICRDRRSLLQSHFPQQVHLYSLIPFWAVWLFPSDYSLVSMFPQPIPALLNWLGYRLLPCWTSVLCFPNPQTGSGARVLGGRQTTKLSSVTEPGAPFPVGTVTTDYSRGIKSQPHTHTLLREKKGKTAVQLFSFNVFLLLINSLFCQEFLCAERDWQELTGLKLWGKRWM